MFAFLYAIEWANSHKPPDQNCVWVILITSIKKIFNKKLSETIKMQKFSDYLLVRVHSVATSAELMVLYLEPAVMSLGRVYSWKSCHFYV